MGKLLNKIKLACVISMAVNLVACGPAAQDHDSEASNSSYQDETIDGISQELIERQTVSEDLIATMADVSPATKRDRLFSYC